MLSFAKSIQYENLNSELVFEYPLLYEINNVYSTTWSAYKLGVWKT